ncbi:cation-transporting P-type ATPase [Chondrocystis sp. NIES-4102]|nr:cation-transporting P-type ATPase [Chondrocystis sp. NIES-4102]
MVKSAPSTSNQEINKYKYAPQSRKKVALDVAGMKCAGCVKAVEKQLEQNNGVVSACVNLITEVAVVEYETQNITPEDLAAKLTKIGFPTKLRQSEGSIYQIAQNNRVKEQKEAKKQAWQLITAAILLFFSSIGHLHHLGIAEIPVLSNIWFHFTLATLALLIPGRSLLVDGYQSLIHRMPNMNTLVGLGTSSAYLASCAALFLPQLGWDCFFDEPVMLLGFIFLGRTIEAKARNRAAAALVKLVSLQPPIARLIGKQDNTQTIEIPVEQVKPGEWLRVLPGEKIPVDGKIVAGETTVDESMLTGESLTVFKSISDIVRAGTINHSGVITVEVTQIGQDTALAKIINLVEEAQTRKAPVQKLADTIAGYFAYGVMAIALLTFCFWYFIGTNIWTEVLLTSSHSMSMGQMSVTTSPFLLSLKSAIAVLVIACPCALGLATPTAIVVGTSMGAEMGILIKGGDVLERVQQLDTVVFDKTGTLTNVEPQVTQCLPLTEISPQELLKIAAAVESGSNHPLAKAIISAAQQQDLVIPIATKFQSVLGEGICAEIAQVRVLVGNHNWLSKQGIIISQEQELQIKSSAKSGKTIIAVGSNGQLQGIIAIESSIRADAAPTIQKLQTLGLNTILLTGDREEVAKAIALKLKISQVFSQVKPDQKATIIKSLQQQGKIVAMVGDGINDAPALAEADVGISLQGSTDVAIATADIVLMQDRLEDIISAIHLSTATVNKIKQNLIWALAYNIVAIPLAAGILLPQSGLLLSPIVAALAMASSSVIVVTNSLLLKNSSIRS